MAKRGLDQLSAWVGAVVASSALFGGAYGLVKMTAGHGSDDDEHGGGEHGGGEHGGGEHGGGGGHGESQGHGSSAEHGEGHGEPEGHGKPEGHGAAKEHGEPEGHGASKEHGEPEGHGAAKEHGEAKGHGEPEGHGKKEPSNDHGSHDADEGDEGEDDTAQSGHGAASKSTMSMAAKSLPAWEYKGSAGPEHWGELGASFKLCESGKRQSPIDIDAPVTDGKLLPIRFNYKLADVTVRNTGHAVQVDYPIGNYIEIDGERFDLVHFDFHTPSEHKVAGIPYDLEMHLVHKNPEGDLAVIGVVFEESRENSAIKPIWGAMPQEVAANPDPISFDASGLLPKKHQFYQYTGSLTTPPCSEGVRWFVLVEPLPVSSKQVDAIAQIVKFNARPVQPLYSRRVSKSTR